MPMPCSICSGSHYEHVNAALHAGISAKSIADQFGLSPSAVLRHSRSHLSRPLSIVRVTDEFSDLDLAIYTISGLQRLEDVSRDAASSGDSNLVVRAEAAKTNKETAAAKWMAADLARSGGLLKLARSMRLTLAAAIAEDPSRADPLIRLARSEAHDDTFADDLEAFKANALAPNKENTNV